MNSRREGPELSVQAEGQNDRVHSQLGALLVMVHVFGASYKADASTKSYVRASKMKGMGACRHYSQTARPDALAPIAGLATLNIVDQSIHR
eukprot:scaffold10700_cov16-Prasinocladus_malaysianus.AAC.2